MAVQSPTISSYSAIQKHISGDFLSNKTNEVLSMYKQLGIQNYAVIEIALDILKEAFSLNKKNIKISKTGENELLIYTEVNGEYRNIIIDSDADVEYLNIPVNRANTYNEHFPFVGEIDAYALAEKL